MKKFMTMALLLGMALSTATAEGVTVRTSGFRTVILSSDVAPGAGEYDTFNSFSAPLLANDGRVAFGSMMAPSGSSLPPRALWRESAIGNLQLIGMQDQQAPGLPDGVTFATFNYFDMNEKGEVAFATGLRGPGITPQNGGGLWTDTGGNGLQLISRLGDTVDGSLIRGIADESVRLTNNGTVAVHKHIDAEYLRSNWTYSEDEGLRRRVRNGDPAPGLPSGVTISNVVYPESGDGGDLVYYGGISGPGVNFSNDWGIWTMDPADRARLVVREGALAAGFASGGPRYYGEMWPIANDNRQIAFTAGLSTRQGLIDGIWKADLGGRNFVSLVTAFGMQAPGEPAGNAIGGLFFPAFNDLYHTAFIGSVVGPTIPYSEWALWSEAGGNGLQQVARQGELAPGFGPEDRFAIFLQLALNDQDQLMFLADATTANYETRRGVWIKDPDEPLRLLFRVGDTLDVDNGPGTDLRTIRGLSLEGPHTGRRGYTPTPFNDRGELAVRLTFTDDTSGIFVFNTRLIPEPGTWPMVVAATVVVLAIGRCAALRRGYSSVPSGPKDPPWARRVPGVTLAPVTFHLFPASPQACPQVSLSPSWGQVAVRSIVQATPLGQLDPSHPSFVSASRRMGQSGDDKRSVQTPALSQPS